MFQITVKNTMWFSLMMQILTGLVSLIGIFYKLSPKDKILSDILTLELIVQFVEMIFYVWIAYAMIDTQIMTSRRYIDWVITTPTMLLATVIFMEYQYIKKNKKLKTVKFWEFIKKNKKTLIMIFVYNFLMLAFGFLGEIGILPKYVSILIGFYFFYKSFRIIYSFAKKTRTGKNLFLFLVIVWGLYGVAALLPVEQKNISYNLLDIVAKNFYGLYLFYNIIKVKKNY